MKKLMYECFLLVYLILMPLEKLCSTKDIPENDAKRFNIKNFDIAVFNVNGEFYAINRKCTHMKGNLAKGLVEDTTVRCPLHGAKFNLKTGELVTHPGTIAGWFKKAKNTTVYKTKVKNNDLYVDLPQPIEE